MALTEIRGYSHPDSKSRSFGESRTEIPVRVLVVDDVEANLELFRLFLARERAEVTLAGGGEEALEAYDVRRPDCLFLDLRMPGMDGIEVAMEIRRREAREGRKTFIAGMSGGDPGTDRMCCEAAGMDCFLQKPVTARQIQSVLAHCARNGTTFPVLEDPEGVSSRRRQPSLQGVHLENMLDLLRGNWDLLRMAVENRFLPQIRKDLGELQDFVQRGELQQAERVAHKMKGNLSYFGKNSAALLAEKVRFSCERGDLGDVEQYLPAFAGRCAALAEIFADPHWEHAFTPKGEYRGGSRT
jgi:CheY-like chemotaxis protein/HPt (histidine-containing phosphotransfer) domain-containing protein